MATALIGIFLFLQQYIVPIIFAIGVIFFLYGFVNSFMLERPDVGHATLLHSCALLAAALLLHGVLVFLIWVLSPGAWSGFSTPPSSENIPGASVDHERSVLPVPNAPRGNH